jgi:hypothetical protein
MAKGVLFNYRFTQVKRCFPARFAFVDPIRLSRLGRVMVSVDLPGSFMGSGAVQICCPGPRVAVQPGMCRRFSLSDSIPRSSGGDNIVQISEHAQQGTHRLLEPNHERRSCDLPRYAASRV